MKKEVKKAQSQIVSTVLLILITIVAATIIFGFVIPFVKEKISSGDCLDVIGKIDISSAYTCYNDATTQKMQVQVHVGEIRDLIEGFTIELGGASTDNYEIKNGTAGASIDTAMCNGISTLELPPKDNTERTYVITASSKPSLIRVYPILAGGKVCDASDVATEIDNCLGLQKCP